MVFILEFTSVCRNYVHNFRKFDHSTFARNDDQQKALKAGFQMHLPKPLNPE
ncbi:hypothetical protein [Nostoc sp.]|uniref:hypothetical protein n=1 Tax=Nostoc sp. TaxID=1180 RepID=UPI002FF94524